VTNILLAPNFFFGPALAGVLKCRTQFWKETTQGSFQKSLVEIGSVVSKIEISSNGQNCSILSHNVPKFELYKHNDELFNIYYGIFMNFELLSILTDYAN
jgi:hypothetical protein